MSCDVGEVTESLENELCYDYNYELCSFSNLSIASPTSKLILQPFCRFTYVTAHSPTFPSLHLCHNSFSNPSITSPMSQLIIQLFRRFTYVTAHSPTLPSLYLRHNSFSNLSITLPTSQLILQPFHHFTYVTAHSPTLSSLYLRHSSFSNPSVFYLRHSSFSNPSVASPRHSSFSNPSVASPTPQLILQAFLRFTYVTAHSPILPLLHLRHSSFSNHFRFSYVTCSSLTSPGEPPMPPRWSNEIGMA